MNWLGKEPTTTEGKHWHSPEGYYKMENGPKQVPHREEVARRAVEDDKTAWAAETRADRRQEVVDQTLGEMRLQAIYESEAVIAAWKTG